MSSQNYKDNQAVRELHRRREYGESLNVTALRKIAHDMPYKGESSKTEILAWLEQYCPERLEH